MRRWMLAIAAGMGLLGVALGAFGAHGLEGMLPGAPDAAKRIEWWETAARIHLAHAVAMGIAALAAERVERARASVIAGACFLTGVALFSGSLYAMALGAPRALGMVTPLGGLALMAGWIALIVAGVRAPR